jgi:hypothetical protein
MLLIAKIALQYFTIVFAAGFALGAIRTLLLVPRLGVRFAELLEAPFMLAVVYLSARWLTRRAELNSARQWLAVGLLALALMLVVEFTVVLWLRGVSLREYLVTRDPVSGCVYLLSLGVFAACPRLVFRSGMRELRSPSKGPYE